MDRAYLIDISAAVNQNAGIGRYGRELTRRLIPLLDPEQLRLWYAPDDPMTHKPLLDHIPWSSAPVSKSLLSRRNVDRLYFRQQLPLGRLLRLGSPTDVYSPDFTAPEPPRARIHITVHDLAWLHPEAATPPPLASFLGPVVARAIRSATTVFTVSQTIRQEVLTHFAIPEGRVIVAPNAADDCFFHAEPLNDAALVTFGIRPPFFLYVGTIEPRKNLTVLFDALAFLPSEMQLVLAGRNGWQAESILARVETGDLGSRVVRAGFVPEELLPRVIAAASAVVYPSRYEGFGLPLVEGLAAGVPVAASDLPVFREVGGAQVEYFDPEDPRAVAVAIERTTSGAGTKVEARMHRQARARRFDWQQSAGVVHSRLLELA